MIINGLLYSYLYIRIINEKLEYVCDNSHVIEIKNVFIKIKHKKGVKIKKNTLKEMKR